MSKTHKPLIAILMTAAFGFAGPAMAQSGPVLTLTPVNPDAGAPAMMPAAPAEMPAMAMPPAEAGPAAEPAMSPEDMIRQRLQELAGQMQTQRGAPDDGMHQLAEMAAAIDTDGDGKISRSEFLAVAERLFDRVDANDDDLVDRAEAAVVAQAVMRHMQSVRGMSSSPTQVIIIIPSGGGHGSGHGHHHGMGPMMQGPHGMQGMPGFHGMPQMPGQRGMMGPQNQFYLFGVPNGGGMMPGYGNGPRRVAPAQDQGSWSPPPAPDAGGNWSPPQVDNGGSWSMPAPDQGGQWTVPPTQDGPVTLVPMP